MIFLIQKEHDFSNTKRSQKHVFNLQSLYSAAHGRRIQIRTHKRNETGVSKTIKEKNNRAAPGISCAVKHTAHFLKEQGLP